MSEAKPRVTFTDWRGSLIVYTTIWLVPAYYTLAITGNWLAFLAIAPYIFLVMMAQHKLHRATKMTTVAKYTAIDCWREFQWFQRFMIMAAVYAGFVLLLINMFAAWLAIITALMICLYSSKLFHREPWIGICYYMGFLTCYWLAAGGLPPLREALIFAGIASHCTMLHKGLRIVTGDYGPVPVPPKLLFEVLGMWVTGVVFYLLAMVTP